LDVCTKIKSWQGIFLVKTARTLESVLEKFNELFQDELGKVDGVKAKFHVDPKARPRWTVPFAYRKKVEEELERLLSLGIIEPVQYSD
jgi:hypothetical protein